MDNTFLFFWLIGGFVPWLYLTVILGSSFIPTTILLRSFPVVIIAISMRMNYRKITLQESR